jgi:hypothetical protein
MWTTQLIVGQMENKLNALVVAIEEIVYWLFTLGPLVLIFQVSLDRAYVSNNQLHDLKWFVLYF